MGKIAVVTFAKEYSKRLENKNLKILLGQPLLRWTVDFAKQLDYQYYVFTPDQKIKDMVDDCLIIDEPNWCLPDECNICKKFKYVNEIMGADIIILLQVTNPLRDLGLVNKWIKKFVKSKNLSGYSVCNGKENGSFYIFRKEQLDKINIRDSYSMLFDDIYDINIDIDTQSDFDRAEKTMRGDI